MTARRSSPCSRASSSRSRSAMELSRAGPKPWIASPITWPRPETFLARTAWSSGSAGPVRPISSPGVRGGESPRRRPIMTYALWIGQVLLALLFLFAGGMKLVLPLEELTGPMQLPGWVVRFIGVAEVLGAIRLILPGLVRLRLGLTPLAAAGLVLILSGATVLTLAGGDIV